MDTISLRMLQLAGSGYCCSQILLALALETQGRTNPGLLRAMSGLCNGLGDCSGACGLLTGGVCLLGYHAGKGQEHEEPHDALPLLLEHFRTWFAQEACAGCCGVRCVDILGEGSCGSPNPERCGALLEATYAKCVELVTGAGIDPTLPREGDDG